MKNVIIIQVVPKGKLIKHTIILLSSMVILYTMITLYFTNHFFFNTTINGVDVSLRSYDRIYNQIAHYVKNYELELIEEDGSREVIQGSDIELKYKKNIDFTPFIEKQKSYQWIVSLFNEYKYYMKGLYSYNEKELEEKINTLHCLNRIIVEPQNVSFHYINGSYHIKREVEGNKINRKKLLEAITFSISNGKSRINLYDKGCYEMPRYFIHSEKTVRTRNLLNKYITSVIVYKFGDLSEVVDRTITHNWFMVDDNLDVIINETEVAKYIYDLSKKYDTVGITRTFHTSTGKDIVLKGGLYGWKINQAEEMKALIERIKEGLNYDTEPIYSQKARNRELNEIGNTYVEINITRQHLWFYKDGKLVIEGPVVTGNPNRGNATVLGAHMLNYKQKDVILRGVGYEAKVTYWMPFYGNIGLHDASWRTRFGGEIYRTRGSHGCVNAPPYIARTVYELIEEGIPFLVYEE